MLRKCKKLKIAMFSFAIIILSLQLSDFAWPESVTNEQFTHTAEIIFNRNQTGLLTATIIPYASDGPYARSGWIDCEIIDADIVRIYSEKLKSRDEFRGYFIATYKKLEENRKSLILRYKGELLRIEPWNPSFIKKDR